MISTTTSLSSSVNPSTYGQQTTLTATVTPGSSGPTLGGSVTFYWGAVALGSASVTPGIGSGTASLTVGSLPVGTASLSAAFSGDGNYNQSSSSALSQTVNKATPTVFLWASSSSPVYGQAVTFTLSVSPLYAFALPPSGSVMFYDGATALGTAALVPASLGSGFVANLTVTSLSVGTHSSITATYAGTPNYNSVTSSAISVTVGKASTSTALSGSPNPSALCQSVVLSATVSASSPGSGTPTGSVTFTQGGTSLGSASLSGGVAQLSVSSLGLGSNSLLATYGGDSNFDTSASSSYTQTVNAAVDWVLSAAAAAPDPRQGLLLPFGPALVSPLSGGLLRMVPLDGKQHTDCDCGCSCNDNNQAELPGLGLVHNTATVAPQPIILATLASDFCATVPSQIQTQLTFDGTTQSTVTWNTTGHASGDVYEVSMQVDSAVSASGIYPWSVQAWTTVSGTVYNSTVSGLLPVVVNTSSPFGPGWAVAGTQSLLVGSSGVAIVDNGTGGSRYFSGTGPSYTSPANDQGTLVKNMDGSYTYTAKNQVQINFDSSGRLTSKVDPHGLTLNLSYASPLSEIIDPDGGILTFTWSGGVLQSIEEPGGRFVTLSYDGGGDLVGLEDAAGTLFTFAYDSHRLVNEQVSPLNVTYSYDSSNHTLSEINRGLGTTLSITAAAVQGLGASTAINSSAAVAAFTDALSHTASYTLDSLGRTLQMQTADGALQTWTLDSAGNPVVYIDQLARVTSFSYNAYEDLTQIAYPDGTFATMQYELTFHQMTQSQDALNHITTWTYDGTTSDLLTIKDALGKVTTNTWSGGLLQTVTDALGRVSTNTWDSSTRRMLTQIDALGHVTTFGYDSAGNQTSVEDALTHTTSFSYDGDRRLLSRTNALGAVATFTYDFIGDVLTTVDELGRTTSNVYDQRGFLVSMMEAVGTSVQRTTTNNYDVAGNLLYVTDALAEITSFGYDALNRQIEQIEAYGSSVQRTTSTVYDLVGNVLSRIDARGTITSFAYNVRDWLTAQIEAYGTSLQRTTTSSYDAVGNLFNVINPRGTITSYAYDADKRQTQRVDAAGTSLARTTTTSYDAVGNVLSVTNAVGAITSYGYDLVNRVTQAIEAYGSGVQRTTTTVYDAVGNTLSVTNARGYVTSFAYDVLNRLVERYDAFGNALQRSLTSVYDAVGNLLSQSNGLGVVTSFVYDALNRRVNEVDAFGTGLQRTVTSVYDLDDNLTASIDALGYLTTFGYDALNRQITLEASDGGVSTTVYDANDNVVNTIDPLGHTTTYSFDVLNRKTQTTDARAGIATLSYDANDNLLSLTDPVNNLTQWSYDLLDRKIEEIDPLSNTATWAYDAVDRVTSATDRNAQRIAFSYDALNRETGETWKNAAGTTVNTLTFTFDANDNLLGAANNTAIETMSYDALDRTSTVQSAFGAVLTNTWDAADNRTLVQDSLGGITTRVYDALNRVATVQFGGVGLTPLREDFSYTARDQVANQTRYSDLAGTTTIGSSTFGYASVGRLTNLQHLNGVGSNLANFTNTFDLASRITAETLNGGTPTSYSYDATDELTNDSVVTYSYDLCGNRTMTGYTNGPANEMTSDGTWNYFYDANGNVISKTNSGTGEVWSFGYDNRNRLISAQDVTAGLQMQATYSYDALDKRIEKDVWTQSSGSTTTTRFAYDDHEIWADLTSANVLLVRYVRGESVLELLARVSSGGTAAWMLTDRMGTLRNVVDDTGALIDTISYDGYGNVTSETNAANGGNYKPFGYRVDSETGWLRPDPSTERYYDSATGRWMQADPMQFRAGDGNLYRYVNNAPTLSIDPRGSGRYPSPVQVGNFYVYFGVGVGTWEGERWLFYSIRYQRWFVYDSRTDQWWMLQPGTNELLLILTVTGYSDEWKKVTRKFWYGVLAPFGWTPPPRVPHPTHPKFSIATPPVVASGSLSPYMGINRILGRLGIPPVDPAEFFKPFQPLATPTSGPGVVQPGLNECLPHPNLLVGLISASAPARTQPTLQDTMSGIWAGSLQETNRFLEQQLNPNAEEMGALWNQPRPPDPLTTGVFDPLRSSGVFSIWRGLQGAFWTGTLPGYRHERGGRSIYGPWFGFGY